MKTLLILLLLSTYSLFAQNKDTNWVYVDSIKINAKKIFINPENIKSVRAEQLPVDTLYTSHKAGIIHIERKRHNKLICIKDLITNSESLKNEPIVNIVINGKLIEQPEKYFIEEEAIEKLKILTTSPSLKNSHLWHTPTLIFSTK
ncbi:hypothetical protein [Flavobacterium rhizosphaerae]|uniref:Uncharacterized protein n=1 Tax=Flavobacterium rhizosphaerae TaxID=3163298 RepID=A0ABW8YWB2_9FLAO